MIKDVVTLSWTVEGEERRTVLSSN
jgi:hypothetical protein